MSSADDLQQQANALAEQLRQTRSAGKAKVTANAHELATLEARLTSLWAAIRQARAGDVTSSQNPASRTRSKWDGPGPRSGTR
jgi:hypothetical protein